MPDVDSNSNNNNSLRAQELPGAYVVSHYDHFGRKISEGRLAGAVVEVRAPTQAELLEASMRRNGGLREDEVPVGRITQGELDKPTPPKKVHRKEVTVDDRRLDTDL